MNPALRPTSGATIPSEAAPRTPTIAPALESDGETAVIITTPNAIDEGSATSIAARPPHTSPATIFARLMTKVYRRQKAEGRNKKPEEASLSVILSEAKDLRLRNLRFFAVFAAQNDGEGEVSAFCLLPSS